MPRTLKILVTDETLAHVREYCRITGGRAEDIINQDWSEMVNDTIRQFSDLRHDYEIRDYRSRGAAKAAAARFWRCQGPKWQPPLCLKFKEHGVMMRDTFDGPGPLPDNWLRRKDGQGFVVCKPDISQEQINKLVDQGVI